MHTVQNDPANSGKYQVVFANGSGYSLIAGNLEQSDAYALASFLNGGVAP